MTTIEKLDLTLNTIQKKHLIFEGDLFPLINMNIIQAPESILLLKEQGLIKSIEKEKGTYYFLTIKGDLFWEKQGFRGERNREDAAERRIRNSYYLNWILGIGVSSPFLWYLLDLINKFSPCSLGISIVFLLLLVGGVIGALIILIMQYTDKAIKKLKHK